MKVKINRREYEISERDLVYFNGACYIFLTIKTWGGWHDCNLSLPKTTANKLIKKGIMYEVEKPKGHITHCKNEKYYRFRMVE